MGPSFSLVNLMMRKITYSFFAGLYLLLTMGVQINAHYCLGKLRSVSFNLSSNSCPCGEGIEMPCCEDKSVFLQLQETHDNPSILFFSIVPSVSPTYQNVSPQSPVPEKTIKSYLANAPPSKAPAYIAFQRLTYYG